ncbi:MAG: ABC transporter ATP-binding protein [Kiritimatiellaeota bacterium]|nr:ABC transporter ATP-binding protein [Kiritimatiellota bacterium]
MLLSVEQLGVAIGGLNLVRNATFDIRHGECVALVGESGCGKSLSALALTRLPPTHAATLSGTVRFEGRSLLDMPSAALREVRRSGIAYIFQDPASALNPVLSVERQLREAGNPDRAEMARLMATVQLPPETLARYPHELSGGMQQRVMIAMAIASRPRLLIADEPTTALDVTTQRQILALLDALRQSHGMAVLLITHNLALVAHAAARAIVMYAGETVESAPVNALFNDPRHPYTRALLRAVPRLDMADISQLHGIPGRVPSPAEWPRGCAFAPRCPDAQPRCHTEAAPIVTLGDRTVRCVNDNASISSPPAV